MSVCHLVIGMPVTPVSLTNIVPLYSLLSTQAGCLLDPTCLASLSCPASCTGEAFVAGLCQFECGEAGTRSAAFLAMMLCWGSHRCQEVRPSPAGPCAATTESEGLQDSLLH